MKNSIKRKSLLSLLTNWLVSMSTEEQILRVAQEVFYRKGLSGARMQEIADAAGINKAMLHYYFKTKEQLFDKVFASAFEVFSGKIAQILNSDEPLHDKIAAYVNHTIDVLQSEPGIPLFVLHELTMNPQRITQLFADPTKINVKVFNDQVKEISEGKVDPENLFTDMVALCIYPFITAPILGKLFHKTDQQYSKWLNKRKSYVIAELLNKL